jgi:hypothetical protein
MEHYAGLDASLHLTVVCVIDKRGRVVGEGEVGSGRPESPIPCNLSPPR